MYSHINSSMYIHSPPTHIYLTERVKYVPSVGSLWNYHTVSCELGKYVCSRFFKIKIAHLGRPAIRRFFIIIYLFSCGR